MNPLDELKFDASGLIPVIAVDADSGDILMLAYMNRESLEATLATGNATYWSRSRQELWIKGGSSGHFQRVKWLRADCDKDALLIGIEQLGVACHTGRRSCFFSQLMDGTWQIISDPLIEMQ